MNTLFFLAKCTEEDAFRLQVLFCNLTDEQTDLYREYLRSRQCERILDGGMHAFVGLILLRKLCNHPDLLTGGPNRLGEEDETADPTLRFGYWERSGKMAVVHSLLRLWKRQEHKVLLFSQSRQMLSILDRFLTKEGYRFLRMDGSTNIGSRQGLVQKFNTVRSLCLGVLLFIMEQKQWPNIL